MKDIAAPNSAGLNFKSGESIKKAPYQGGLMESGNTMGGGKGFDQSSDSDSDSSNSSIGSQNDLASNSIKNLGFPKGPNLGGMNNMS